MIEASKTAELSSQPTKCGRRAWLIGLAVVVAVVAVVLLATAPKPEPVKVWFVRATNEAGVKMLVFEGTNGLPREITFIAYVIPGAMRGPETPSGAVPSYILPLDFKVAQKTFSFTLRVPAKDVPYCVMWQSHDYKRPMTPWRRFQMGCYRFLIAHKRSSLARPFIPKANIHYIPSTDIKE